MKKTSFIFKDDVEHQEVISGSSGNETYIIQEAEHPRPIIKFTAQSQQDRSNEDVYGGSFNL